MGPFHFGDTEVHQKAIALVRIKTIHIHGKWLSHKSRSPCPVAGALVIAAVALRGLTRQLRNLDDDKLGRLQQRYANHDVHHSVLLIVVGCCRGIALDLECFARR
jgi:hypothetical protein